MARGVKVDIEEYLTNLKPYLEAGCSLHEACLHSLVPYTTMVDYIKADEDVRKKIDRMQNVPILLSKQTVINDIKAGEVDTAKWFLERKCRDEFNTKQTVDNQGSISFTIVTGVPDAEPNTND